MLSCLKHFFLCGLCVLCGESFFPLNEYKKRGAPADGSCREYELLIRQTKCTRMTGRSLHLTGLQNTP